MMKSYRFKLYRSKRNHKLHRQINSAGLIYNHCIALYKRYYKLFGKYLNKNKLQKHLVKLKKLSGFGYINEIGSQAVQDVTDRIDRAYQLFFRNIKNQIHCSPPNFKKIKRYKSFTLKQSGWEIDEDTHTLKINGQKYKYFQSRRINGKIKTITIKRDTLGDIYVHVVTDAKDFEIVTRTGKSVGFDFGLKNFLTASDGRVIESPLFFMQSFKSVQRACKNLSRKIKGSKNRERARLNLARLYRKTFNRRQDFHFKLARHICLEYETICIEDLNMKAMHRLYGRKVSDLAFSAFVNILKYEATKFGTKIVEVNRFFASSQICHCCGKRNPEVKDLKIRHWVCLNCGAEHERDINAAINILNKGLGHQPVQEAS